MPWVALTLEVDARAAEALSEALLEAGAQSVAVDGVDQPRCTLNALLDPAQEAQALVAAAALAVQLAEVPAFTLSAVADEDWVRKTQAQFRPMLVGERLWIGPSWHQPPAQRVAVCIDPGLAFGTGTHPSTRLVLQYLEARLHGGERVLDYGCGSGILAIAAAKLGAVAVEAVDVDPQAVLTCAANARLNRVEIQAGLPERLSDAVYDVVLANILAQPLIVLAPLLAACAAPGARIALSGILESQATEVAGAYAPWFQMAIGAREEGWALVEGRRK